MNGTNVLYKATLLKAIVEGGWRTFKSAQARGVVQLEGKQLMCGLA